MKIKKTIRSNLAFLVVVCGLLAFKAPQFFYHFGLSETHVQKEIRNDIKLNQKVSFPPQFGPSLVIYWASWCAPCKLEMERLKISVESGNIRTTRIFAVNMFESLNIIQNFLKTKDYPFTFISTGKAEEIFNIKATPSTVILIDGKIYTVSQGMSLIGVWKAEYLFRHFKLQ